MEAIRIAETHWFDTRTILPPEGPEIGDVFAEWLNVHPVSSSTIRRDYLPRTEMAKKWFENIGLVYWSQIKPRHLQQYANACAERGNSKRTIQLHCRVITMAAKYVKRNHPEQYHPLEFDLPRSATSARRKRRPRFPLTDAVDFLFFLREQRHGWNILPGVALSTLCSLRMPEVRALLWESVDLDRGLVHVVDWLKNEQSDRTIPMPRMAWDILGEASSHREGERVLSTHKHHGYRQAFIRYRDRWRSGLEITPSGLRRVLRTEFFFRHWDHEVLEIYRGHKPQRVSDVDWEHYIEEDPEGLVDLFRLHVTDRLDEILGPYRDRWNGMEDKVIPLRVRTG